MKVSGALLAVVLLLFVDLSTGAKEKQTRNVVVTADDEKVRDAAGYAAIAEIHKEMDDDHSGSIDRKETSGFMTEDMHMRSSDRVKRENAFHGDDDAITVDDLWEAWFESEERAWTTEQLLHWVVDVINLPMYADMIVKYKLDGTVLPRLAVLNATFMTQKLGIKSSVHRQKLRLNALDVVLFGYREVSSRSKDIALALLLLVLTSVLILFARQRQRSRREVGELSSRLTQLKSMETEFEDVQKKWNDERSKRSTTDGGVNKMEMESLRIQLQEAERRLEQGGADGGGTPLALQPLLRRTCENEMAFLEKQRQDCFKEMKDAIEMVDRLQKKTSSVLSSLKLATGASTASDQVDSKIFALKSRMEKIHGLTRDTQERWLQIESLCGFPILYLNEQMNGGMYSQSSHFYASNSGASSESSRSLPNGASSSTTITSSNGQTTAAGGPIIQQKVQPFHAQRQELDDPQLFPSNGLGSDASAATVRLVPISHADTSLLKQTEDNLSTSSSEVKKRRAFAKLNIFKKSSSKNSLK